KDWRKLGSGKQKKQYAAWLREDRQRGFDLGAPPLMRVTVFGVAEGNYRFVWTFHHVLLDATAFSIVLEELFAFYEALRAGYELELSPPRAYGEYVAWLAEQDPGESFWRELLRGFEEPTPLVVAHSSARALVKGEET